MGRIAVIGPQEVRDHSDAKLADILLDEGATGPENIYKGLAALTSPPPIPSPSSTNHPDGELAPETIPHPQTPSPRDSSGREGERKILIVTTDLPFLTPELLQSYIDLCPLDKDFTVPLVGKNAWNEKYPGFPATFVKLRDGEWTTGCAYIATVDGLRRAKPHIERVFENRKSKLGMAKLLGPGFVLKYLMKKLSVDDVEKKVRQLLDCSGVAVPNSPPELAFDLDYLDDYEYAKRLISSR